MFTGELGGGGARGPLRQLSCIFKVHDDCRQDALALQVIQLLDGIYRTWGLPLFLFPYRVVPNRTGKERSAGGIIEVCPDCKSRDQLGKQGATTLRQYFLNRYGAEHGARFERAQRNFSLSLASYAVACFLLQIKDRHNGNLLLDGDGHVIHIDFGFLLGRSPGHDLKFETAAFKLTKEMIDVLGGSEGAPAFERFVEQCVRGFLAARDHMPAFSAVIDGMGDSALPCYKFPNTLKEFRKRFAGGDTDRAAARFMHDQVHGAYDKMTTWIYDGIQKLQNDIFSDTWK